MCQRLRDVQCKFFFAPCIFLCSYTGIEPPPLRLPAAVAAAEGGCCVCRCLAGTCCRVCRRVDCHTLVSSLIPCRVGVTKPEKQEQHRVSVGVHPFFCVYPVYPKNFPIYPRVSPFFPCVSQCTTLFPAAGAILFDFAAIQEWRVYFFLSYLRCIYIDRYVYLRDMLSALRHRAPPLSVRRTRTRLA